MLYRLIAVNKLGIGIAEKQKKQSQATQHIEHTCTDLY